MGSPFCEGLEMIRVIRNKLEEEIVFTIAMAAALGTSLFVHPRFESVDFKVLLLLFDLMLVALAFEKYHLLGGITAMFLLR